GKVSPVAVLVIVPKKFARVATLTGSPALLKKVVTVIASWSIPSVSVTPLQPMSGSVNQPSSVKVSFSGAFAEAGTDPPITIRAIAPRTTALVTSRMGRVLSTPEGSGA